MTLQNDYFKWAMIAGLVLFIVAASKGCPLNRDGILSYGTEDPRRFTDDPTK